MSPAAICQADDQSLIRLIGEAQIRVVFAAPGLSKPVAESLKEAWERLGPQAVTAILDVDPAVCRLGYGTDQGLLLVQNAAAAAGTMVCHQPGLRIGVLVADQATLVFTPTPLLVEPAPGTEQARANAILLSAPPEELKRELGLGSAGAAEQTVGLDPVRAEKVHEVVADLEKNPPLPFDVVRQVNVFNARVEFVEFNLEKIQLQRQQVPIPRELMGLADKNIHGFFQLDPGPALLAAKEALEKEKRKIDHRFTRPMRGFGGSIIRRADKLAFEQEVEDLETKLETFRALVRREFSSVAGANQRNLIEELLPVVKRTPPAQWKLSIGTADADMAWRELLRTELSRAFAKLERVTDEMRITYRYKGVTYECLKDPEFVAQVERAFSEAPIQDEFTAAREREKG